MMGKFFGSSRPKLVPTANFDSDDLAQNSGLAIKIQYFGHWRTNRETITVICDSDTSFTNALDIAPFGSLRRSMLEWKIGVSDTVGCIDLSSAVPAFPSDALLGSPGCPALLYIENFHELGLTAINAKVVHDARREKVFDARGINTRFAYMQTVLTLEDRLKHNVAVAPSPNVVNPTHMNIYVFM